MTVKVMKGWFVCGRAGPFPVCASLRAGGKDERACCELMGSKDEGEGGGLFGFRFD
jgi:hypothetical protein